MWNNPPLNSDIHIRAALETAAKSVWQFHDKADEFLPNDIARTYSDVKSNFKRNDARIRKEIF